MRQLKTQDWLILGGVGAILLVNPLIGQYIIQGIIIGYEQLMSVGDYIMVAGLTSIVIGYFIGRSANISKQNAKYEKLKSKKSTVDYIGSE